MDCVNHSGVTAAAYCQSCGKALCQACVRKGPGGQIFCQPCWAAWSAAANAPRPFVPPPLGGPSPVLAGFLGFIPGVGAMYNSQYLKAFLHVVIFMVLVSMSHVYGIFGLFVMAWIFYQVFEAYQTARARRDGDPLPDPLGLNELSNWIVTGGRPQQGSVPGAGAAGANQAPFQSPYQGATYTPPAPGTAGPAVPPIPPIPPVPPVPPVPPAHWQRREPIGAVILIGLGILLLLGQFSWFSWDVFKYFWPLVLIGLGVWLIARRMHSMQAGPPDGSQGGSQGGQK